MSGGDATVAPVLPNPWTTPTVSLTTAARLLGIHRSTAYRRAAAGSLPTIAGGRVSVFALYGLLGAPVPVRPVSPAVRR